MSARATRTEDAGFDGMLFTEGGRTAFPAATAAALAAPGLQMSTGVAVAFPRRPKIAARVAWEVQELTDVHFRLGLGTQVRTHVVRRHGVDFERPGTRLIAKYDGVVDRLAFYNPAFDTPHRRERYGSVARTISERTAG